MMRLRFVGGLLVNRETGEILFDPRDVPRVVAGDDGPSATSGTGRRVIDWKRLAEAGAFAVRRARANGWLELSLDDETRKHLGNWFSYWGWVFCERGQLAVKERLVA